MLPLTSSPLSSMERKNLAPEFNGCRPEWIESAKIRHALYQFFSGVSYIFRIGNECRTHQFYRCKPDCLTAMAFQQE